MRDTPDLQFSLESYDVSPEVEALVTDGYEGREIAGGTFTTGDPNLVVDVGMGNFDAQDVGRMVIVEDGNGAGVDLVTTIASVTSPDAVTLTDAPTADGADALVRVVQNGINLANVRPIDIASQFKAGKDAADPFKVVASVAVPFLYLESMSYRFGLRDNATQSGSFRGDTIFYNPGPTYVEETAGTGIAGQAVVTVNPAYKVAEGDNRRVLAVTVGANRLSFGADYTETYGAEVGGAAVTTVTLEAAVAAEETVRIVYSSPTELQYPQTVHPSTTVKPAAVKGRDIEIYLGGYDPNDVLGSQVNKLTSVQAVQVDWRVQIDKDEEFGNYYAVGLDFEVPTVSGSVDIKPRDPAELLALIRKAQGIADANAVLGTASSTPLPLDIVIKNPDTGETMKRLHVNDARFTPPGFSGRVQQKTTVSLPFESDEGDLLVFAR